MRGAPQRWALAQRCSCMGPASRLPSPFGLERHDHRAAPCVSARGRAPSHAPSVACSESGDGYASRQPAGQRRHLRILLHVSHGHALHCVPCSARGRGVRQVSAPTLFHSEQLLSCMAPPLSAICSTPAGNVPPYCSIRVEERSLALPAAPRRTFVLRMHAAAAWLPALPIP